DAILDAIREYYGPMIESGATTVWESFPSGTTGGDGFPTRSHTHAWSSAPIHFLNRLVLGIVPEAPGGTRVRVSPWVRGLEWAKGSTALARGPVSVDWRVEDGTLRVTVTAPDGVTTRFERNETHEGLRVVFNGQDMP
ncbi:MAG TPA: alpha-L-rhamnosidase C-terminal domain-containing protein, partial [Candidatus Hydrogenedentes bacterium]|nr:alpha-L-rhamnosidase C-terminal domain-containing protein [Candidatus Hydrogenedentota bacterium]